MTNKIIEVYCRKCKIWFDDTNINKFHILICPSCKESIESLTLPIRWVIDK